MMIREILQKKYLKPTIRVIALQNSEVLAVSNDQDIPYDPEDGTDEALAREDHSIWDEEYYSWKEYTTW